MHYPVLWVFLVNFCYLTFILPLEIKDTRSRPDDGREHLWAMMWFSFPSLPLSSSASSERAPRPLPHGAGSGSGGPSAAPGRDPPPSGQRSSSRPAPLGSAALPARPDTQGEALPAPPAGSDLRAAGSDLRAATWGQRPARRPNALPVAAERGRGAMLRLRGGRGSLAKW